MGELGGLRAEGGEGSDDLSHVDVGAGAVALSWPATVSSGGANDGSGGDGETHFEGVKAVVG